METIYLRTLIEAVETGSVSEAAERLFVTPSAVSRRIKYLEDMYGCLLLDRTGGTLKPTEAGRLVMDKAAGILAIERELTGGLRGLGENQGISFCCTPGFGIAYLPGILRNFMLEDAKPDDLNLMVGTPDDVARRFNDRVVDIAVLEYGNLVDMKGYERYPLPDEELVFVSAPGIGIGESAVAVDALTPHRVFLRADRCCYSICLEENLKRLGMEIGRFNGVARCDDLHVIIRAVEDGVGVTYLSRSLVEGQFRDGKLRAHYVEGFVHRFQRALAVRRGFGLHGRRAAFVRAVFSAFGLDAPL